jgi:hypothetical protein
MKTHVFAAALLSGLFSLVAYGANSAPPVEDEVDRDIGRQAAAKVVAETLVNDQAYEYLLSVYMSSPEMEEYLSSDSVKKAADADPEKAKEAVVAASKQLLSKAAYAEAMAAAIAESFTYSDLKQILAFVRSDVGKRYSALTYDEHFAETLAKTMFKGKETPDPRPVLEKELRARFPKMIFKF